MGDGSVSRFRDDGTERWKDDGQLLHLGLATHVVDDGQWLQSLRHAAR